MPDAFPASSTRDRLIQTAMKLFWEKGYESTSVADVLREARANSGSLYHFFPGKQDVLMGVLELYRDGISQMLLEPAWQGVADPIDRIFALPAMQDWYSAAEREIREGLPEGPLWSPRSK